MRSSFPVPGKKRPHTWNTGRDEKYILDDKVGTRITAVDPSSQPDHRRSVTWYKEVWVGHENRRNVTLCNCFSLQKITITPTLCLCNRSLYQLDQ